MSEPITREQLEVMKRGASHEVALLIAEVERLNGDLTCAMEASLAIRARVEELEKALKEYADPDNWNDKQDWDTCQVYIARATLGKEE